MRKFWSWAKSGNSSRVLYLDGVIADNDTWFSDDVTPKAFKAELTSGDGDVTVYINSPGGDVFAAAQIYTMLKEYPGRVVVKVDALAASAASVVAMSGDEILMSPAAFLMLHDPMTLTLGDEVEHERAVGLLQEVKESIINVYALRTGLSRTKLAHMMADETWLNAHKAVELGFADKVMFTEDAPARTAPVGMMFSRMAVVNSLLDKLPRVPTPQIPSPPAPPKPPPPTTVESLYWRLNLILH